MQQKLVPRLFRIVVLALIMLGLNVTAAEAATFSRSCGSYTVNYGTNSSGNGYAYIQKNAGNTCAGYVSSSVMFRNDSAMTSRTPDAQTYSSSFVTGIPATGGYGWPCRSGCSAFRVG